jgi:hypothetical protein
MVLTELAAHDLVTSSETTSLEHHDGHKKKTGKSDKLRQKKRKHVSTTSHLSKIKHTTSLQSLTASQDETQTSSSSPPMAVTISVVETTDAEERANDQDEDEEARRKKERRRSKREESLVSQETGRKARRATPPPTSPTITKLRKVHSLVAMAQSDGAASEDATGRALLDESQDESEDYGTAEKRQLQVASALKLMTTTKNTTKKKTKKHSAKKNNKMLASCDDDTTTDDEQRSRKSKKEAKTQRLAIATISSGGGGDGDLVQSPTPLGSPVATRVRSTSAPDAPLLSPRGTHVLTPSSSRSGHSNNLIYGSSSSAGIGLSSTARWTGGIKDWLTIRRMNKQRSVSDLDGGSDHHGAGDLEDHHGSMQEVRREARTAMGLP